MNKVTGAKAWYVGVRSAGRRLSSFAQRRWSSRQAGSQARVLRVCQTHRADAPCGRSIHNGRRCTTFQGLAQCSPRESKLQAPAGVGAHERVSLPPCSRFYKAANSSCHKHDLRWSTTPSPSESKSVERFWKEEIVS